MDLAYGVFRGAAGTAAIGVATGDRILDLRRGTSAGLFDSLPPETRAACTSHTLNALMALTPLHWHALRERLKELVESSHAEPCLVSMRDAEMLLPVAIGDYTDFYASIFHATNVGKLFRPDNPLLPNYKHIPVGYHGRASSIVVSGTPIRRPNGQTQASTFGPTGALDYELEVGFFIGAGNALGRADPHRVRRESHLRHLPGQRLVGPRYTGLGIPAARPVSGQELRNQHLALGDTNGSARSVSRTALCASGGRPRAAAVSRFGGESGARRHRSHARSGDYQCTDARERDLAIPLEQGKFQRTLLVDGADGRAPYKQRLQSSPRRSAGQRHRFGSGAGFAWLSARNHTPRRGAGHAARLARVRKFLEDGDEITLRGFCEREGLPRVDFGECTGRIG